MSVHRVTWRSFETSKHQDPLIATGPSFGEGQPSHDHVASCVPMDMFRALKHLLAVAFVLIRESVGFLLLSFRSTEVLRAERFFLRRQLALYA